jgi:hypothetical protein
MMQFTHALLPQAALAVATLGKTASLETGKGFNHNQIAKLKDACGVNMAKDIPHIWYVIQRMKDKAYNTYRGHFKKSIKSWCRTWHIEWDKSIYLKAKSFDDLVAMRFNPGGLWHNTTQS